MSASHSPPERHHLIDMSDPDFVERLMMRLWSDIVPVASNIELRASDVRRTFFHEGSARLSWVRQEDGGHIGISVRTARRPDAMRPMIERETKIRAIGTEFDEVTFCLGDPDDAPLATFGMPLEALLGLIDRSMSVYQLSDGSVMTADTQNQMLGLATINIVATPSVSHSIMCVMKEAVIREYVRLATINGSNAYGDHVFAPENNTYMQMGSEDSMVAFLRSKETEAHLKGTSAHSVLERLKILMSLIDYCIERMHLLRIASARSVTLDPSRAYATVQEISSPERGHAFSARGDEDDDDADGDLSRGTESSASSLDMYSSGETSMAELQSPAPSPTIQHPNIKIPIDRAMEFTAGYDVPSRPSRLRGAMIAVSRGGSTFQELRSTVVPPHDPEIPTPYAVDVSIISYITDDVNYNTTIPASSETTLLEIEKMYYSLTFPNGKKHPICKRVSKVSSWMFTSNWDRIARSELGITKLRDIALDNPYFVTIYMSFDPTNWPAAFRDSPYRELMIEKRDAGMFGETAKWWA